MDLSTTAPRLRGHASLLEQRSAPPGAALDTAAPAFAARQDAPACHELVGGLRSIAVAIDDMWHHALDSQDFDLVWRASEASHAVHRAVLALEDDGSTIG